ncbi:MAG TPA: EpsG family protein [Methanothrix sp.]|nr:EpsG family protein [Methanothrix sp.]
MRIQEDMKELDNWSSKNTLTILQHTTFFFIMLALILFAGFREIGFDPDSPNYASIIESMDLSNFNYLQFNNIEPSFYIISYLSHWIFDDAIRGTFIIYALLGVALKMLAIYRLSRIPLLSVFFYICYYYPLHDLTQIRTGVASAIFLLAIPDIVNQKRNKYIIKTIIASLFHYQAIIMLLLYPIINAKIGKWFYFVIPILGLAFSFLSDYILDIITTNMFIFNYIPSFLSHKIILYIDLYYKGELNYINVFNLYYMSLVVIYYFSIINIDRFESDLDTIMIKILGLSVFAFPFFSFLPVFAFRISEFLGIVIMILLASIVCIFKQKSTIVLVVLIYSLIALCKIIFATALFRI